MYAHRLASLLTLLFVSFAQSAHAFFGPPSITPQSPMAGETVSVNIRGDRCNVILQRTGFPQITRSGNSIRILESGNHYEPGSELCIYPPQLVVEPIGEFKPGNYTLTVDFLYYHPVFGSTILNIGVANFVVAAPPSRPSVPVSALNGLGLFLLIAMMLFVSTCALRMRRPELP